MARLGTGIMVVLFWTGLALGPVGASGDRDAQASTVAADTTAVDVSSETQIQVEFVDRWLADVAACEAGRQTRCAPILR